MPTDPDKVPASAARISREWLSKVMCRDIPGAEIVDVEVVGGSDGTNTRRALKVTYNDAGAAAGLPDELFVKSATAMRTRLMNTATTRGESEVRFYRTFGSRLPTAATTALFAGFASHSGRQNGRASWMERGCQD